MWIGIAALGILASACGDASADAGSADGAASPAEAASPSAAAARDTYEPAPLRGPDLSGLLDADEEHVLAPLTMDARIFLNHSFDYSDDRNAVVPRGARKVPTTDLSVTPRVIAPDGGEGLWKVRVDFEGQWEGLQVLGLGTDTSTVAFDLLPSLNLMFFEEPIPVVAKKLAELGIDVNPDGSPKVLRKLPGEGYPAEGSDTYDWHGQVSMVREQEGKTAYIFWEGFFDDGTF